MRKKLPTLLLLMGFLFLAEALLAQEYLDLWRSRKTDDFYLIQKKANEYFAKKNKDNLAHKEEGEGSEYVQFKRWEEFMEPRVYPSGKLINPAKLALDEELRYNGHKSTAQRTGSAQGGNWSSLGIKNYTTSTGWTGGMGRVNCIVPHPTDPQTLFIGTPSGGIWKTTDGGTTWIPLSDGLPVIGVSGIAINPNNPDNIFILTGDGDGANTYSVGVFRTTNGGNTWQSTGLQWNKDDYVRGYELLMHPTNRRILFAVTDLGIYKTADGGVNWSLKKSGEFTDIAFKPGDPSVMYATALHSHFYTSTDMGENWTPWTLDKIPGRTAIGVTAAQPNYIYLVGGTPEKYNGVYGSQDGGQTWISSLEPNLLGHSVNAPFYTPTQALYDLAIAMSPINPNEIHIGGINCWKSVDAGNNWIPTSYYRQDQIPAEGYTHADIHALVFNGNRLYCGSDGGIFYSDDHATSWHDISRGLEITQFYRIAAPYNDLNTLYGGSQDNGLNKWTFPDANMDHKIGGDIVQCLVDYSNKDILYGMEPRGISLRTSKDGGASWNFFATGLTGRFVTPMVMHPTDPTRLYAGYNAVTLITDDGQGGVNLTAKSPDFNPVLVALGMSVANTSYVYAATSRSLKRSANIDSWLINPSWVDITGTLPVNDAQITSIQVSPINVNEVWVCLSGYANGKKVYFTADGGATWTNVSGTLPNVPVNCIAYYANGQDGLFIGTDIGVFYRDNTTGDWVPFRNGLPNVVIRDLEITLNKIRAATFGRGIWESDLEGTCPVNVAQKVNVSGNQFRAAGAAIAPCTCADDYELSGAVVGYQSFQSSNIITSTADIMGGVGTDVTYKAANNIMLNTGFKVAAESRFTAFIDDCGSAGAASNQYRGVYDGVMPGALGLASIADSTSITLSADRLKVYPNPLSLQSTVEFYIAKQTSVTISLWDQAGKKIKNLFESASQAQGNYQVRLDAAGISSGTYFVRLQTQDYQETKKIVITK